MIVAQHAKCWVRIDKKRKSPAKGRLEILLAPSEYSLPGLALECPDVPVFSSTRKEPSSRAKPSGLLLLCGYPGQVHPFPVRMPNQTGCSQRNYFSLQRAPRKPEAAPDTLRSHPAKRRKSWAAGESGA
jgi:hypothetical protein